MTEEFKVGKARALLTLEGSRDPRVSQAGIQLRSGRKWAVDKAVDEAKSRLRHSDMVGVVAQGRLGLVNLKRWGKEKEEKCQLCERRGTLSHVLSSCPIALGQGRYRWRHDQVLRVLACTLEEERTKKRGKNRKGPKFIGDWNLRVDLDRRLVFPEEIASTNLKPDVVLWSTQTKQIVLVELTVPWEERIEEAYERKALKYQNLLQDCVEKGDRMQRICGAVRLESARGSRNSGETTTRYGLEDGRDSRSGITLGVEKQTEQVETNNPLTGSTWPVLSPHRTEEVLLEGRNLRG
ncbi:hypothetical protein Bbelb_069490 [Branchiostoma belcheri]|nr:hypothetical protein Bbelb_069490 [Branchiostoma belcheri]